MKFTMFAAGQNADPATKMSHQVSVNCTPPSVPFLEHGEPTVEQRRTTEQEEVTQRNLLRCGLHGGGPTTFSNIPKVLRVEGCGFGEFTY